MQLRPSQRRFCHARPRFTSTYDSLYTLLFIVWSSVRISAQSTTSLEMTTSVTSTSPPSSLTTSIIPSTITTSPTDVLSTPTTPTDSQTNNTTSASTSSLFPLPPRPIIPLPPSPTQREKRENSLVNIYFLLLGLGIIFVIFGWWCFRRRKKEKRARSQDRGRNALARDLEGWVGQQRRWMYGGWRGAMNSGDGNGGGGGNGDLERSRARGEGQEEGLNERGEAPPPYKPPERDHHSASLGGRTNDLRPTSSGAAGGGGGGGVESAASQEIPLTDLSPSTPRHPPPLHIADHHPSSSPPKYETLQPP